jgi:DNA-binding response OmpR family regulator
MVFSPRTVEIGISKTPKTPADPLGGISTILLAEADGELRGSISNLLREHGCFVLEADDQRGALFIVQTHSRQIDVLVIAIDLNHSHFFELLQKHRPGMLRTLIPRQVVFGASEAGAVSGKRLGLIGGASRRIKRPTKPQHIAFVAGGSP